MSDRSWRAALQAKADAGTLDGDELVRVLDDPSGTSVSKQTTVDDIGNRVLARADDVYQPLSGDLTAIAALTTTTFGRSVLDRANAAALATLAGVGTGDSPQFTAINLGHASDATLARAGAGRVTLEGYPLLRGIADLYVDERGAAGDGVYLSTGTATATSTTFTCASASWTSADIGKRIVIMGAGAAGATLATTIAAVGGSTSITLGTTASTTVTGTAKCYYGTDDTSVIQTALNALTDGQSVILGPRIYMVSNLSLPGGSGIAPNGVRRGLKCLAGTARLVATGTGDNDYLVASAKWPTATATGSADGPFHVHGIYFDAFGLADLAVVHKMYGSVWSYCTFSNALVANYRHTRRNQDDSSGTTSYLFGTKMHGCWATGSIATTYGFHLDGTAADPGDSATDGSMIDCDAFGGGMTYGMYFGNTGGWTVMGCRTWDVATGAYVYQVGKNASFQGNNWDCTGGVAFRVFKVGAFADFGTLDGDSFYSDLWVDFTDDATTELFSVENGHFYFDPQETTTGILSDGQARIVHNNNRATKTIRVKNCTFQAETPFQRNTGNTLGIFDVYGNSSVEDAADYQRRYYDSGATGAVDRVLHDSASPAAADVLHRLDVYGRDSGGNVTQYVVTEHIIDDPTDTQEDGGWQVRALLAGALTQRLRTDRLGTWIGASTAQVPSTGALGLHVIGTGFSTSGQSWSRYSNDADGSYLIMYKSRGATAGTNTIVSSGDTLGRIRWVAGDGTNGVAAAEILAAVDGTPGTNDMPGRLVFATTADGASSATERMRISNDGSIGIGGSSYGSGAKVIFIANATTNPSTNPTGGGVLYCDAGALKYRGSSGTVTTLGAA